MKKLNRDAIKYIAIFAMLLDHIAWYFLAFDSLTSQIFHFVGRTTAPIMCFFIAEGYIYTRNQKKYALRLLVFALISQIPWWLLHGSSPTPSFNMIFTLFIGLLAVHIEATLKNNALKIFLIALICVATYYCDWKAFAVLWCVGFYKFRDDNKKKLIWFSLVALSYFVYAFSRNLSADVGAYRSLISSLYCFGSFLSVPLLLSYNGENGKFKGSKWVFYIFYPLHLFIIAICTNLA